MDAVNKSVLSYSLGQVDAFVASVSATHPEGVADLASAAASFRAEQVAASKKSASQGRRTKRGGDASEGQPKRKLSPYNEFMGAKMRELSSLHPETSKRDLMKQAAEQWRAHKATLAK